MHGNTSNIENIRIFGQSFPILFLMLLLIYMIIIEWACICYICIYTRIGVLSSIAMDIGNVKGQRRKSNMYIRVKREDI